MRKCLWYCICLLDTQFSYEQSTEPLITADLPQPTLPRNVDDTEFEPGFEGDLPDHDRLTDMTFARVTYRIQADGRRIEFTSPSAQNEIEDFEREALRLIRFCDPNTSSYAWFTFHATQGIIAGKKLARLRPFHRMGEGAPPRIQDSSRLLELSITFLDKIHLIRTDARGEGFRWCYPVSPHPLAIAITECHACDDASLVQRIWPLIEMSFHDFETPIADYRRGALQKVIGKLMSRTRERVSNLLSEAGKPAAMRWDSPPVDQLVPKSPEGTLPTATDSTWTLWEGFVNDLNLDQFAAAGFPCGWSGHIFDSNID
jgi:hypothetical protein